MERLSGAQQSTSSLGTMATQLTPHPTAQQSQSLPPQNAATKTTADSQTHPQQPRPQPHPQPDATPLTHLPSHSSHPPTQLPDLTSQPSQASPLPEHTAGSSHEGIHTQRQSSHACTCTCTHIQTYECAINKVCGDSYIHYAASVLSEYVELMYHVHTCITTSFTSQMCQCEPCAYTTMHNN